MARRCESSSNGASIAQAETIRRMNHDLLVEPVIYRECRHNYAASMGRYIIDGCGEFQKSNEDDGSPDALLCGACGCHRSFHRKELRNNRRASTYRLPCQPYVAHLPPPPLPPPPPQPQPLHILMYNTEATPINQLSDVISGTLGAGEIEVEMTKKRKPRTMLTVEQKNMMRSFAERLNWKPQRRDDEEIRQFCSELGITTRVFKVWLNNNRGRRESAAP